MTRGLGPDGRWQPLQPEAGAAWRGFQKPWPAEIDQWTHYLHGSDGNPVARDTVVGPPAHVQWVGGPRWLRTSYVPDFDAERNVVGLYTVTIDVHELTVAQEQLRRSVERDMLTDVLSRRTMMDRIEAALVTAAYEPVALFFVDLDGFKAVNDRLGHREGDALLIKVAQALQGSVRADDAVGRLRRRRVPGARPGARPRGGTVPFCPGGSA